MVLVMRTSDGKGRCVRRERGQCHLVSRLPRLFQENYLFENSQKTSKTESHSDHPERQQGRVFVWSLQNYNCGQRNRPGMAGKRPTRQFSKIARRPSQQRREGSTTFLLIGRSLRMPRKAPESRSAASESAIRPGRSS